MDLYELLIYILTISTNTPVTITQDGEPWILHSNLETVERLELNTWTNRSLIRGQTGVVAVDYHYTQGYIYWADQIDDRIQRASLSNLTAHEDVHTSGLDRADAIAVDWIYNHLYWVDINHEHLAMSQLDGSLRKTLLKDNLKFPRDIVVHPGIGWVFFSDIKEPKIEKCGLDGSSRTVLVSQSNTNLDDPNGLAIDFDTSRLFWIDNVFNEIRSCKFDGTDIRLLMQSQPYMPYAWGLALSKEWLYWTNFNNNTIVQADKVTGNNIEFIKKNLHIPVGIKVFSSDNQPSGTNLCVTKKAECDHLCLASPQNTAACACADGFQLKSDGKGCQNIGSGTWLIYANLKTIERLDMETNVTQTIAKDIVNAVDLDVHYEKGFVYWTDVQAHKISRSEISRDSVSNEVEDIITDRIITSDGIAVDWMYDLLYWTDTGLDHIQVSQLDGTEKKTIIKDNSLQEPRAIAVDPNSGWLFFSDWGATPRIERCGMNGEERLMIVNTNIIWPNGMSIDHVGKRLYWIDGRLNKIESARFDGTDRFTLIENTIVLPKPFDLVVFNSNVYWSNWQNRTIYSLNKYSIKDFKIIALYLRSPMGITVYGESFQPKGQNVCGENNGGCSHICYPLPARDIIVSISSGCMCPDEYTLSQDKKTCITPGLATTMRTDSTSGRTRHVTTVRTDSTSESANTTEHRGNPDEGLSSDDEVSSSGGNKNAIIIGAALGSVIVILGAIFLGIYCRHRQKRQAKRKKGQPNSAYHCFFDNESQCTTSTIVDFNPYETLNATNLKNAFEPNIYEEINQQSNFRHPTRDTNQYHSGNHGSGMDNQVFEGSNPTYTRPKDDNIYLDPTC